MTFLSSVITPIRNGIQQRRQERDDRNALLEKLGLELAAFPSPTSVIPDSGIAGQRATYALDNERSLTIKKFVVIAAGPAPVASEMRSGSYDDGLNKLKLDSAECMRIMNVARKAAKQNNDPFQRF